VLSGFSDAFNASIACIKLAAAVQYALAGARIKYGALAQ
jgi:hypothetical protein